MRTKIVLYTSEVLVVFYSKNRKMFLEMNGILISCHHMFKVNVISTLSCTRKEFGKMVSSQLLISFNTLCFSLTLTFFLSSLSLSSLFQHS